MLTIIGVRSVWAAWSEDWLTKTCLPIWRKADVAVTYGFSWKGLSLGDRRGSLVRDF
jgi:hypothetical protein